MILTVTPNPMLEKNVWLPKFTAGSVHRAEKVKIIAGGKGINVSRALVQFNESTLATGFLGGYTGKIIEQLLNNENIPSDFVEIDSTTREGITIFENSVQGRTAIFDPGHELKKKDIVALCDKIEKLLPQCQAMALCGSMPSQDFNTLYSELINLAHAAKVPLFLDSYHEPLKRGLTARPQFVKPNREEALETFGIDIRVSGGLRKILKYLHQFSPLYAFVTDSQNSLGALCDNRFYQVTPPQIQCVNDLGSGDTFLAGFLYGWINKMRGADLICFATAAGTVNAMHWLPGYVNLDKTKVLAKQVRLNLLTE